MPLNFWFLFFCERENFIYLIFFFLDKSNQINKYLFLRHRHTYITYDERV